MENTEAEARWEEIKLLRDQGQPVLAQRVLLNLLASDPENPRWLNGLAVLESELARHIDGITTLSKALHVLPAKPERRAVAEANSATLYLESGWRDDGMAHAEAALAADRDLRRAHLLIGLYASKPVKVLPAEVFQVDRWMHVYPYLNFDLAWKEEPWVLPVLHVGDDRRHVRLRTPSADKEKEFRLSLGRKVIAGVALEEAFYGAVFTIDFRDSTIVELAVPQKSILLVRVQRRNFVRASEYDPISQLLVQAEEGWKEIPRSHYQVIDLSASGIRLFCRADLTFGQRLRVTFRLDRTVVQADATVCWLGSEQRYGLELATRDERDTERLHKAVFQAHSEEVRRRVNVGVAS